MLTALKGTFRNGKVELDEDPGIVGEASVVVTFLSSEPDRTSVAETKVMTFGMLADPTRKMSNLDDFKIAEYDETTWDRGQTP